MDWGEMQEGETMGLIVFVSEMAGPGFAALTAEYRTRNFDG